MTNKEAIVILSNFKEECSRWEVNGDMENEKEAFDMAIRLLEKEGTEQ